MDCTPSFVYEYIFSEIVTAPVYRVLSSWYYSKQWIVLLSLCISLFFHNWQCGNLQGIVYSVLLQAMDCTPIFVYLYTFQRLTVQYLICSMCGWSCQQAADCIHIFVYLYIVFISLCICTLYSYLCVSVHFPSVGSAVICLNVRLHGYVNKPQIVFISLCICTLSISWQCSNLLKCQVAWLCQQATDCIHAFVYLYTFHQLAVQ